MLVPVGMVGLVVEALLVLMGLRVQEAVVMLMWIGGAKDVGAVGDSSRCWRWG